MQRPGARPSQAEGQLSQDSGAVVTWECVRKRTEARGAGARWAPGSLASDELGETGRGQTGQTSKEFGFYFKGDRNIGEL